MESQLEDMWCSGIKGDKATYAEIVSKVEAKCNVRMQLSCVTSVYPGFVDKLFDYADVTQNDIDNAWLEAALDVMGRPAVRLTSRCSFQSEDLEELLDSFELPQGLGQRIPSMDLDEFESFAPTSAVDFDSSWLDADFDIYYELGQANNLSFASGERMFRPTISQRSSAEF
jgi:hypothetical protein